MEAVCCWLSIFLELPIQKIDPSTCSTVSQNLFAIQVLLSVGEDAHV